MTFHLSVLPAGDGDCLLLTYRDGGRNRHLLIDGGRPATYPHLRKRLQAGLQAMGREEMPAELDVAKLAHPTPIDPEPPNGSSIAFIAEWQGRRILFAGDAHPDLLAKSLAPLAEKAGGRLPIDLLKVSHHGSRGNTTRRLVELLDCRRFLISTDGKRHGHPDPEATARLLAYSPPGGRTLYFNYRTKRTNRGTTAN